MRRGILIVLSSALLLVAAGCGSEGVTGPVPKTVVGSLPKPTVDPATPAFKLKGDAAAGKYVFLSAGCTGCHTLAAAHSTGTVGPNLDQAKPAYDLIIDRVTNGKGPMPPFTGQLNPGQIKNVAAFVYTSTHHG